MENLECSSKLEGNSANEVIVGLVTFEATHKLSLLSCVRFFFDFQEVSETLPQTVSMQVYISNGYSLIYTGYTM